MFQVEELCNRSHKESTGTSKYTSPKEGTETNLFKTRIE